MFQTLVTMAVVCLAWGYQVSDFKPSILKPSPPSGYHSVDTGEQTEGEILCFGDINGDQYNDYIAITKSKKNSLLVYFWSEDRSQFMQNAISLEKHTAIGQIEEAMLSDLTSDGTLEVIITYATVTPPGAPKAYETIVYGTAGCGQQGCSFQEVVLKGATLSNMTSVPTLVNFMGAASPSFLGFKGSDRRMVQLGADGSYQTRPFAEYTNNKDESGSFNKVDRHFTSNVDFNGDCHSDLVLLAADSANRPVLQFYQKQTNSKLNLVKELTFQTPVSFVTFADIDASGTVDIVLILGPAGREVINVIYNTNKEITEMCQTFAGFPFDIRNMVAISLPHSISNGVLQLGDVNSDTYPDILAIFTVNDFRKAVLYKNTEGADGGRQFKQSQEPNAKLITQVKNPKQVAFFDLGENGKLDIMVMVEESKNSDGSAVVTRSCFINNVKDDTLFIKILPLSQSSTYEIGSSKLSNAFGITFQWLITRLDGNKKISLLNQKSQWNYGTLQLPFVSGGLGRTNNYVEDLTVGYEGIGQKMSWSPIIPDSKLLIYEQNSEWKLETLLTNNERVNHVVYVSIIILVVLGLIIIFLNYRENKEDRKDQYNFIQLIR